MTAGSLLTCLAPPLLLLSLACWLQLEGNLVKWERWNLRVSFNYREGLVSSSSSSSTCLLPSAVSYPPCAWGRRLHYSAASVLAVDGCTALRAACRCCMTWAMRMPASCAPSCTACRW